MENKIGLAKAYTNKMAGKLNDYLSNIQVTYMNVRGYHWNVEGKHFFGLHAKFEEIYNTLNEMADEVAERILMLDGKPVHSFTEYIKTSKIKEKLNLSSATETVQSLLDDIKQLLALERDIIAEASANKDEGTVALMSGYIGEQEKMIWMFNAFLK
jgi:starvation-inducible DNA-binding protein